MTAPLATPTPLADLRPDRAPDMLIGPPGAPCLERWFLIPRNDAFNVYYHRILRDDDNRALHDHPWPSFSIMLAGALREITPAGARTVRAPECVYREAEAAHRLELIGAAPAETLFLTGPRLRSWGFHCPQGWIDWRDFVDPENPGAPGRGCGDPA